MRAFSARMFPDLVVLTPVVYGDDGTARTKAWPPSGAVPLAALVQLSDPTRRGSYQGATRTEADGVALFAAEPGAKVDDQLAWQVTPTAVRTFGVLGPATPEGGRSSLYSVPIREVR